MVSKYVPSWKHNLINFKRRMKQYAKMVKQEPVDHWTPAVQKHMAALEE